jgi:type I restriction enzyme M protein
LLNAWGEANGEDESEDGRPKQTIPEKKKRKLLDAKTWQRDGRLVEAASALRHELGGDLFEDHNVFCDKVDAALEKLKIKLGASDLKTLLRAFSWRVETAPPVIAKVHKPGKAEADPLHGLFPIPSPSGSSGRGKGEGLIVKCEPDSDLRDTEQVPLLEEGGIEAFIGREVLPYTPDAWIDDSKTEIGYEISFTRHFYKPQPLRTLDEIRADILNLEKETEGLLGEILVQTGNRP